MKNLTIDLSQKFKQLIFGVPLALRSWGTSMVGFSSFLLPLGAQSLPPAFRDIEGYWAQQCIQQLAQRNIMGAYNYSLFRPNLPMTRGDYAAMIIRAFPHTPLKRMEQSFNFIDLPETYWGVASVREAWLTGFMIGYPGNIFAPFQPITRLEVILSLMAGLGYLRELPVIPEAELPPETPTAPVIIEYQNRMITRLNRTFADAGQIPPFARDVIFQALDYNLIVNYPNVQFLRPNQLATRGEIAALVCQALKTTATVPSAYIVR